MLKTIARQIPQIDRLVRSRDAVAADNSVLRTENALLRKKLDRLAIAHHDLAKDLDGANAELQIYKPTNLRDGPGEDPLYLDFKDFLKGLPERAEVLELGTLRWHQSTIRRHLAPQTTWLGCDAVAGLDVDVVADAHKLTEVTGVDRFDAIIACSVFEHLSRPWLAANEIAQALKPGARCYVQTHFAFPIHGYPRDYFRFTREALEVLFTDAGLEVKSSYSWPAYVVSYQDPNGKNFEAYLNSNIAATKPIR